MKRKPRAKKKRSLPLSLDFVTALTPAECRGMLYLEADQFAGEGSQIVGFDNEADFWVEYVGNLGLFKSSPVRFEGILLPVTAGTHVAGQITSRTQARFKQARRWWFVAFFVLSILAFVILGQILRAVSGHISDDVSPLIRSFFGAMFGVMIGRSWLFLRTTIKDLDSLSTELVGWLRDCLYESHRSRSLGDVAEDSYEPQTKSEDAAIHAATAERWRAQSG